MMMRSAWISARVALLAAALALAFAPAALAQRENNAAHQRYIDVESVYYAQPQMIADQIAALSPSPSGHPGYYFLGFAGYAEQALKGFLDALKPGGILGIEDHRARDDKPQDPKAENGYVRQDYAIELARKAGFEFVGASEIDANPRDTKDWPEGVWTLPPTLTLKDKDRAKYLAIGEADNFVLKFRKPLR